MTLPHYAIDHTTYKPVKVEDFAAHVSLLQENSEQCFSKEFNEAVTMDQAFSQHNGKLTVNQDKNRYTNIFPCKN